MRLRFFVKNIYLRGVCPDHSVCGRRFFIDRGQIFFYMAKGKSFLGFKRGRAAGLVYSVGRDGAGVKQQIVRGIPETVTNPKSSGQAYQRSFLAAAARLASIFSAISDHAYEGIPFGQANRSAFISGILSLPADERPYCVRGEQVVYGVFEKEFPISRGSLGAYYTSLSAPPSPQTTPAITTWTREIMDTLNLQEGDILTFIANLPQNASGGISVFRKPQMVQVIVSEGSAPVNAKTGGTFTLSYGIGTNSAAGFRFIMPGSGNTFQSLAVIVERRTSSKFLRSDSLVSWGWVASTTPSIAEAVNSYRAQETAQLGYGSEFLDGEDLPAVTPSPEP